MKKGKFGIVLCFYPIAAFAAVILNCPLVCLLITAAAIFLERDEWVGRQTLQAEMAAVIVFFFDKVIRWSADRLPIPFLADFLSVVSTIFFVLVYLAAILFSILGIIRVMKDQEANIPLLSELAYRIYGKRRPKPVAPPVQQYQVPYGMPQQPQEQQYAPPPPFPPAQQPPYAPPQYNPPTPPAPPAQNPGPNPPQ